VRFLSTNDSSGAIEVRRNELLQLELLAAVLLLRAASLSSHMDVREL
jgi:hypothetical protein